MRTDRREHSIVKVLQRCFIRIQTILFLVQRRMELVVRIQSRKAPKARNVRAWANGPGRRSEEVPALKARSCKFYCAPSALNLIREPMAQGVALGYYISRLWRYGPGVISFHSLPARSYFKVGYRINFPGGGAPVTFASGCVGFGFAGVM